MIRRAMWVGLGAAALAAAVLPIPADAVERVYSRQLFPALQRAVTSVSNAFPFALFDVLWIGAIAAAAVVARRRIVERGWRRGAVATAGVILRAAIVVYLAFLAAWGLNYRRVPLIEKVVFDPTRVTHRASAALGDWAMSELNERYAEAHAAPMSLESLRRAFDGALGALDSAPIVTGRPKQTLLGWYFHKAAIAGMTDPFLLETLLAPDLLDVERPFVIAHEWAHLAGYADESEANFVAYLACRRGDAAARYSAALAMLGYAETSRSMRDRLEIGPRTDLFAIRTRYARTSVVLRFAAREGYDKYLKANRVEKGVESYDAVLQLILGTSFDANGNPRLR